MALKLQNVASRIVVLKFQEELEKRRQQVAAKPPTRVLGREMPVERLPSWTQGGGGVSLPNPLDLLNRIAPHRSYSATPSLNLANTPFGRTLTQPYMNAPVREQYGPTGGAQMLAQAAQGAQAKGLAPYQAMTQTALPESITSTPYIGRPLGLAATPATWAFGPEVGAQFVGGRAALGALGRLGWGEKGEEILGTAGEFIGPAALPVARAGVRLAGTMAPAIEAKVAELYPTVREAAVGARGEAGGLKLPSRETVKKTAGATARVLFGQEKAVPAVEVRAWRKQLSEGIMATTGSEKRALRGAAKVAAQSEGDDVTKSALGKVVYWVRTYKPKIGEYKIAKHEELARRADEVERIWQSELSPSDKLMEARRVTTGELVPGAPKATVPLSDAEITRLEGMIGTAELTPFERPTTLEILRDLTSTGRKLTDGEIALLAKTYGIPFASEVFGAQRGVVARLTDEIYELYRIPMQIMSSGELSGTLRQGVMNVGRPKQMAQAFKVELEALAMPKVAEQRYMYWKNHPLIKAHGGKLDLTPIGKSADVAAYGTREEAYLGHVGPQARTTVAHIFNSIPGVGHIARASERTYIAFLNEVTGARFVEHIQKWKDAGVKITPELSDALAAWLNTCRGRGPIGPLAKHVKLLTIPLWAPRLWASRVAAVPQGLYLGIKNPEMRGIIARDLASFVAINTGLLVALKQSGLADVEINPLSTDWGKIRVGPIRIDPWGGFQQTYRSAVQFAMGKGKATETGEIYSRGRLETFLRTVGGKLHPTFGLGVDIARGETMLGEEVVGSLASAREQAWNRLVPLFWQDFAQAVKEEGLVGGLIAAPGFLGVGVQVYETPFGKKRNIQNEIAKEKGYDNFDKMAEELGTPRANEIANADPRVVALEPEIQKYKDVRGGMRGMVDIAAPFEKKQGEDDAEVAAGTMDRPTWLANFKERQKLLGARYEEYLNANPDAAKRFADEAAKIKDPFALPADATPDTVRTAYFTLFDKYGGETGEITAKDWDTLGPELDRFRASLTPTQEASLDENLGAGKSDLVKEYRADQKKMQPFWDLAENLWAEWTEGYPLHNMTYQQYVDSTLADLRAVNKGREWLPRDRNILGFSKYASAQRTRFLSENPDAEAILVKWGHNEVFHTGEAGGIYHEETGLEPRYPVESGGARQPRQPRQPR